MTTHTSHKSVNPKLCIDCKHFSREEWGPYGQLIFDQCHVEMSLVDGGKVYVLASSQRTIGSFICGPDAKRFEAKA